ncbi:MAG TPA: lytic murein transglycosylase [Sedimenticola sp.]|nr:lytic murein transglycosylase [Sedimenticola sp.]
MPTRLSRPITRDAWHPLLLALLLVPLLLQASQDPEPQRARFLAAEQALAKGDSDRYRALKDSLQDYPLYPYLAFQELKRGLSRTDAQPVTEFLETYADTPLAGRMRYFWLRELARRKDWSAYLRFYRPRRNPEQRCLHARALIETGRREAAWKEVPALWLSGRSRPDACDPVFDAWRAAGGLTTERVWQRIGLAMKARQTRLARYLGRFLPAAEKPWLERWLQVDTDPGQILQAAAFERPHPWRETILLHGLKRLARRDAGSAWEQWPALSQRYPFTAEQRYQARHILALALIRSDPPELLARLDTLTPAPDDTRLHEARIRAALIRQTWPLARKWIEALPEKLRQTERWRYWYARALGASGDDRRADAIYRELARERSYFGFLAADRVGMAYRFDNRPVQIGQRQMARIAARPGIRRARELYALGRSIDARREWRDATAALEADDLLAAAKLAQRWGWNDQAIFTLARARYWDDLALRFPLEHRETIERESGKRQMDHAWVFAVIRQESAFAPDAISPAGAMGLMQLMPRTAKETARRIKRRNPARRELLSAETNIELGTAYLNRVYRQLDGHPVLATAAYNAGPHRIRRWLPPDTLPADLWIENIPYRETRTYTQRVLVYSVIYDQRLGQRGSRLRQRMPPVTPRRVAGESLADGRKTGAGSSLSM